MNQRPERDPYGGRNPRDIPAYSTFEASHYLRVPQNTIRNWAIRTSTHGTKPLIEIADPLRHLFSFVNLLELHVISALRRDHNVQMQRIRRAIEYLQMKLKSVHPLIDEEMETDGTDIFVSKYGSLINDPAVAFGRPVIMGSRVPTAEIAERFQAGESPSELAEDFGRTEEEVWEAIRCEFPTAA